MSTGESEVPDPQPSSDTSQDDTEVLVDALYAVYNITGPNGTWPVSERTCLACTEKSPVVVHADEMIKGVQEVFHVGDLAMEEAKQKAQQRKKMDFVLNLTVKEAEIKTNSKGNQNVYMTITLPHTEETHMTRLEKFYTAQWNQEFNIPIRDLHKDHIYLQLWEETEEELSWILSDSVTNTLVRKALPVATTSIPVMKVLQEELDGWYDFKLTIDTDAPNVDIKSVKVHMTGHVSCISDLDDKSQAYEEFISILLQQYISELVQSANDLWPGKFPINLTALSTQFGLMQNTRKYSQLGAWCKAVTQMPNVDAVYEAFLMNFVQKQITNTVFSEEDLSLLQEYFALFIEKCEEKIKCIDKNYPVSGAKTEVQLTTMLQTLKEMHKHPKLQLLIYQSGRPIIYEGILKNLNTFGFNWLKELENATLPLATNSIEKIKAALAMTKVVLQFLGSHLQFYDNVFKKTIKVDCYNQVYQSIVSEMVPTLEPVIIGVCKKLLGKLAGDEDPEEAAYDFGLGSNLLKVYTNLGKISLIGKRAGVIISETRIEQYHQWFLPAVHHWLAYTNKVALECVEKEVAIDSFESSTAHTKVSTSAAVTVSLFHNVKVWWNKVYWSDQMTSDLILVRIFEDQCNISKHYCQLLFNRIDSILRQDSDEVWINEKIPVVVANIEFMAREIDKLPTAFGGDSLMNEEKSSMKNLANNVQETLTTWINQFLKAVVEKVKPTLKKAIDDACETDSVSVNKLLDSALLVLCDGLQRKHFLKILCDLWDCITVIFLKKVEKTIKVKKNDYFQQMRTVLDKLFECFTPSGGEGLSENRAKTPGYMSLIHELDLLKLESNDLITHYYQERWKEEQDTQNETTASLFIRAYFADEETLTVSVIMASDIVKAVEKPAYYVKLEVIPEDCNVEEIKETNILREDPASFDKDFTFENLKENDIEKGFILLTLFEHHVFHPHVVIGEAVIPLAYIKENSENVKNMHLQLDTPCTSFLNRTLQILTYRRKENLANDFLKKMEKRHPEMKSHFRKILS